MPSYSHLTESQREIIAVRFASGFTQSDIALKLGCHKSSICRESRRNRRADGAYTAANAQRKAQARHQRPSKLQRDERAALFVRQRLSEGWSPQQIAGHLSRGIEDIAYVCHEAIYGFIYASEQPGLLRAWRRGGRNI